MWREPAQQRQATIGRKVSEMVETVCGGTPEALETALLDDRGLNADELQRIRPMLFRARTAADRREAA